MDRVKSRGKVFDGWNSRTGVASGEMRRVVMRGVFKKGVDGVLGRQGSGSLDSWACRMGVETNSHHATRLPKFCHLPKSGGVLGRIGDG